MTRKHIWLVSALTAVMFLAIPAMAAQGTLADKKDAARPDMINQFNIVGPYSPEVRASDNEFANPYAGSSALPEPQSRQSVGSALGAEAGLGVGYSVDLTYDDWQWARKHGHYVDHYWNGATGEGTVADVHFVYEDALDTLGDHTDPVFSQRHKYTGYNVYDAVNGVWPRGSGCNLQATDTIGGGNDANLAISHAGLAIVAARSRFWLSRDTGVAHVQVRVYENMLFFQGAQYNCTYDPRSNLNTTWIDSTKYRPHAIEQPGTGTNYGWDPQVATTWDGTNVITHVLLAEDSYQEMVDNDHLSSDLTYKAVSYYRKVGATATAGSWSSGQTIDTTWYHGYSMAVGPYPFNNKLAVSYTNPTYYGGLLNQGTDLDVWIRESNDGGLNWVASRSITNYTNAIAGDPKHFTCWIETQSMFDMNGNLHVIWTAKPTSADPYFDGFNWQDFDENIYHWASHEPTAIVKLANGNFMNDDMLTGSMNTMHCGFGGVNAGYLAFLNISQCNDKLYVVWNQIHERANRFPWRNVPTQPAPGVLDDCAYDAPRLSAANFEVLMSVAKVATPSLWDAPRNITNTYTPGCGLAGDPDAAGICGSEYKPSVETYALNEAGLGLTWPASITVDLSLGHNYAGDYYLNMFYLDDQYPGTYWRQDLRGNTNPTLNSMKWVRIACVEPIEASRIDVIPKFIQWPQWVKLGQSSVKTITVVNEGNVTLNVTAIGTAGGSWLTVSQHPTPSLPFQVPAGVSNTATFQATINASALVATQWLDGLIYLKSDAANADSFAVTIHVLAANDVEPVAWDTVTTHQYMFDQYFEPEGACVALAVGNDGDLGWGAGSQGSINLDYFESGLECGTRARDKFYLINATAFTITATSSAGANARLTQVTSDANQADSTGWDPSPDKGSITGGLAAGDIYDSVYTGKFVNRDTTIAMERIVYGPRSTTPASSIINFVILYTKVYSANGLAHNHVTLGNAVDWDLPADSVPFNTSAISPAGFVYMQGTDTTGHNDPCQSHTNRFGTEAFGGGYTSAEFQANPCVNNTNTYYSFNAFNQLIMVDTDLSRSGGALTSQPDPVAWWEETGVVGLNGDATRQDQCILFTYKYDHSLGATDTLHYWTVLSTVRNGTLADLETQVAYAKGWYMQTVRGCGGCCVTRVGDANMSGDDEPTIGDVSVMIDAKFITGSCDGILTCLAEADINQSGGAAPTCDDITIGDISILIDYLFITGSSLGLPNCL